MSVKVITLHEQKGNVEYVEYALAEHEGKQYVLLILKEVMEELMSAFVDASQILRVLRLYEIRNDSYMLLENEQLKMKIYEKVMRGRG